MLDEFYSKYAEKRTAEEWLDNHGDDGSGRVLHMLSCLHKQIPFASILVSILSNHFATVDIGLYKGLCSS